MKELTFLLELSL